MALTFPKFPFCVWCVDSGLRKGELGICLVVVKACVCLTEDTPSPHLWEGHQNAFGIVVKILGFESTKRKCAFSFFFSDIYPMIYLFIYDQQQKKIIEEDKGNKYNEGREILQKIYTHLQKVN